MKKIWAIRKDSEAVSPVIATILMVAITVVLAAVLYVMVLGFGGTSSTPGIQVQKKTSIAGGFEIAFTAPTADVLWTDVNFQLKGASGTPVTWEPTTEALTSSTQPAVWADTAAKTTAGLTVWLNVTDNAANGKMSTGDYVDIVCVGGTAFSTSVTYTLTLLYGPTGGTMIAYTFSG